MNERPERRQSVIVGLAFAWLLAAGTGLIFLIGRRSGPGARLAGGLVALGGGVGAVLAAVALVRETAREPSSDEDRRRGRIVIWAMFGFAATYLTVGPALGVGLDVSGWIIVAVAGPMVVLIMSVTTRSLRATGMDVHPGRDLLEWTRKRWPLAVVVALLLVGCYAPPLVDTWWRRAAGSASGAVLLGLSLAYLRGWVGLPSPASQEAKSDSWGPATFGTFVGGVCALAWTTGLVFKR